MAKKTTKRIKSRLVSGPSRKTRMEAADLAASIYTGCGDDADSHRVFATVLMLEAYLEYGAECAAEALGWDITNKPADVVPLTLVQNLADATPHPEDRGPSRKPRT